MNKVQYEENKKSEKQQNMKRVQHGKSTTWKVMKIFLIKI